jgi:hypothetical protein
MDDWEAIYSLLYRMLYNPHVPNVPAVLNLVKFRLINSFIPFGNEDLNSLRRKGFQCLCQPTSWEILIGCHSTSWSTIGQVVLYKDCKVDDIIN